MVSNAASTINPTPAKGVVWQAGLVALSIVLLSSNLPFFWDGVLQGSIQGSWFYQNPDAWLPEQLDAGHAPGFGWYLAQVWTWLGRNVLVSHLAMWPWLWVLFYHGWLSLNALIPEGNRSLKLVWLLLLAEPTLMAQSVLVSPDVVLLACFSVWLLQYLRAEQRVTLWPAMLILLFTSSRGLLLLVLLTIVAGVQHVKRKEPFAWAMPYVVALAAAAYWLWLHWQHYGWIGYNPNSTEWAGNYAAVDLQGMGRNVGIAIWRLLDFGRWGLLLPMLFLFTQKGNKELKTLSWVGLGCAAWLLVFLVVKANPIGHRYFLPTYWCLTLVSLVWIYQATGWRKWLSLGSVLLGFAVGPWLIYPDHIAKGWDATIAHVPSHGQKANALKWLAEQQIPLKQVATDFPYLDSLGAYDLKPNAERMQAIQAGLKGSYTYVLYSNVLNGLSDGQLDTLARWPLVYKKEFSPVRTELRKRPE